MKKQRSADLLIAARKQSGLTQAQMAKLLEVSSLTIWKWESGGAAPRASRVPQILQRLALGKRDEARGQYEKALKTLDVAAPQRRVLETKVMDAGGTVTDAAESV